MMWGICAGLVTVCAGGLGGWWLRKWIVIGAGGGEGEVVGEEGEEGGEDEGGRRESAIRVRLVRAEVSWGMRGVRCIELLSSAWGGGGVSLVGRYQGEGITHTGEGVQGGGGSQGGRTA